ncbi:hypothetical protein AT03_17070 [Hafnia alvei FB1]|uniref:Uncharacterized protein n=1 Tax=Hafnia alvei FB1 TaxID=1453496 RepID=A0A097R5D1_HAFAL|nr:hypothetical protein AT03_17070 [Hafnia alvei FB1]
MRGWRSEKVSTIREEFDEINDSMKNKVGAQKGAFIKMKQENIYIYQWLYEVCCVPLIAPFQTLPKSTEINTKPAYCSF